VGWDVHVDLHVRHTLCKAVGGSAARKAVRLGMSGWRVRLGAGGGGDFSDVHEVEYLWGFDLRHVFLIMMRLLFQLIKAWLPSVVWFVNKERGPSLAVTLLRRCADQAKSQGRRTMSKDL